MAEEDLTTEARTISKAGALAMELSKEKRRLQQELSELQEEFETVKSTTPTGTPDWYVKWVSTVLAVAGIFLINAGLIHWGQGAYILSTLGWCWVGMIWGDRAIMIGSSISGTATAMNLLTGVI
ncbi:MAG: hypothetical protein ISQ22_09165 [Rhizobiales bacterium]|nr:hypothetical protein [Hyphomicrobiales bacterium]